jgi:MFS family permease
VTAARTTASPGALRGWIAIAALGLVTITAYGSWFYAFGILVDPIHDDTGWSLGSLGAVFAAAQIVNGLAASTGGRILDRWGGKALFGVQACGAAVLLTAAWAPQRLLFAVLYAVGAGVVGTTGFYHVTTAAAARLSPSTPAKGITVLTAIGAFCSPIYLPLGQLLIDAVGWRSALRVFALTAVAGGIIAATLASGGATPHGRAPSARPMAAMRAAIGQPAVRWMLTAYFFAGAAYSSVLVFQVPIMKSAGIAAGTAAALAGLRGGCQIFGRVGLIATVARQGARTSLQVAYLASGAGIALLLVGSVPTAVIYAVVVGVALGATSPLQAIHAQELFDPDDLGLLMGMQHMVFSIAGGLGPLGAGLLADASGGHGAGVVIMTGSVGLSVVFLRRSRPTP